MTYISAKNNLLAAPFILLQIKTQGADSASLTNTCQPASPRSLSSWPDTAWQLLMHQSGVGESEPQRVKVGKGVFVEGLYLSVPGKQLLQ